MIKRLFAPSAAVAGALLLAGVATTGTGLAQDAGTPAAGGMEPHPAHIHSGTCDTLGDIVFPLEELTAPGMMGTDGTPMAGMDMGGTPMAGMDMGGTPMAGMDASPMAGMAGDMVAQSTTIVDASLDDILAEEHAINAHESAENIQNYIACGDITGTADGGQLQIEMEELNDSGYQGQATLEDNGDGTTTVTVMLSMGDDAGMMATPTS
ncbi:MAG: hypothetical protein M3Q10_13305 [Chloroflexota bacterium]|nr:hypothetical protein [Chloroflexota bacterium]